MKTLNKYQYSYLNLKMILKVELLYLAARMTMKRRVKNQRYKVKRVFSLKIRLISVMRTFNLRRQ